MSSSYRYFWRIISACLFMLSASVYADYTVSGAQNADINGTYVLDIDRDNVPSYKKTGGSQTWYLYRSFGRWYVEDNEDGEDRMGYYSNSSADTPPETGWQSRMDPGSSITVAPAGPGVAYSGKQFTESLANDGSVIGMTTLTHNNIDDAFAGTDGEDFIATGKANISNLPAGLTASLTRQSALTLQLQLSGAAIAAAQTNNVNTLTVQLTDAAFASGNAAANSSSMVSNLVVQFRDSLSVGSTGTYSTIAAAVAAAKNYDILDLAAETFTEKNIIINKRLVIQGQGAGSTIVQAMAIPRETTGRVFDISYGENEVQIKRLTLQNGYLTSGYGGVITASAPLLLEDCHIKNNAVVFSTTASALGGAVYFEGLNSSLTVRRCLFDDNLIENSGSIAVGGAIFGSGYDITIENSTFTNNEAKTPTISNMARGAAINFTGASMLTVINSTITGNKTSGYGAGIFAETENVTIQNSIIYGNTADFQQTYADIYSQNGVNISYSLIGARSTHANDVVANELSANPLFDVLADNGGTSQTIALLSGSPAIAAGLMSEGIALDDQRGYCRINNIDLGAYQQNALGRAITYKANTAFGVAPTYACEMQYATADGLIKAGYSFAGWNTAADGSGTNYTAGDTIMLTAGSYVLYAQWQLSGYAVNYNANGATSGTAPAAQVKQPGVTLLLSNNSGNLVKTNYSFAGWNSAADGTGTAYAVGANYEIDADLTLYAQWAANQFTLSFDSAGGSAVAPIVADFGAAITPPANPTRAGYSFTGWTPALPATMPAANTSVTAQWAVNQFTLSFDSAGGSAVAPIVADFGAAITPPANPTRAGYSFIGWTPALPATMPAANASVTAQWSANAFTLSFDSAGGSAVAPIVADFGSAITPPANPTRAGYSFTGWTPALPATMPAANTSVTAQWQQQSYTVSASITGNASISPASQQIRHGETAVFALNLTDADAIVNIAGSCGAARTGNNVITAAVTQSCNVQISVYPASEVSRDTSVPVSSGHAVSFAITGGAGDKELISAKLMRADIETELDLIDVEALLTKSAEGKYQFATMRTGLYTLTFRDLVSAEYIDVEISVLPYFAFNASAQPVTKGSMANVKLWLSDEPVHYPVTAKLNIEGAAPTIIKLTAAALREYNHIVNVSTEQVLLLSEVNNALQGTPARHQLQLQTAPVALAMQAIATQQGEETVVISQDGGEVTLSALVLNGSGDSYSWSSDSLNIAAATHQLVFDPISAPLGSHKVTVTASNANGQQGQYLLNLQLISHCSEASCYSKTGLPVSVSNNMPQRLPVCPAGDDQRVAQCALAAQGYIETGGSYQLMLGELSLAESWASMQFGAALSGTLTADPDYVHHGVVVNFDITALGVPGESVPVVIALPEGQTIVADAVWRKYINARWQDFVVNQRNLIESAAIDENNRCPAVSSDTWQQGLSVGNACIRLTIEDGGPNDNDGQINGVIQDPGVLAVKKAVVVIPEVPNTDTKPRSSGSTGAIFVGLLALLMLWRRRAAGLLLVKIVA